MSKHRQLSIIIAAAVLGFTSPLLAQERTSVTAVELDAAVAARPAGNQQAVQGFLATEQAQSMAGRMGVSASELSTRVATLDQASLNLLADRTDGSDRNLAGGANTIVISTTTIIIALLLIILLTD